MLTARTRLLAAATLIAPPLGAQQPAARPAADFARYAYVIERMYETFRFEEDGTGRSTLGVRVRIQSDAGLQAFGQLVFAYSSATQRLEIDTVRVRKVGGEVAITPPEAVQDVNSPVAIAAPVYSDLRAKIVTVAALRPGDTLEYQVTWITHTALAPGQFWLAADFARDAIVLEQRLTVVVPRRARIQVRTSGGAEPQVGDEGERRSYTWRHANLAIDTSLLGDPVRLARRLRRQTHSVQLTTFRTWADLGAWYSGLERDREAVTPAIQALADSLVRRRTSLRDSVEALYDFVARELRYVSLSFGVGRYQPHAAAEVLANRYGDCKDKHTLLAALLRAIGVPSGPVLIASTTAIDTSVPAPHQFDHLITWIPAGRDTLWLDATPEVAPFRFLLGALRDKPALVIPPEGAARLMRTPAEAPYPEFFSTVVEGRVGEQGALGATVRQTFRGDAEIVMRQSFRLLPPERIGYVATQLARQQGLNGNASGLTASATGATAEPFTLTYHLEQPGAIDWKDNRGTLWAPLPRFDLPPEGDTIAGADTVDLDRIEQRQSARIDLPPGTTAQPPAPVTFSRDFARYQSTYRVEGRTLVVERSLRFTQPELPPNRVQDLEALRRVVRDDEGQSVLITRPAADRGAAAAATASQLYASGSQALADRDARAAARAFRRVVALEPRHPRASNDLGRALLELGQYDSAAAAFRRQIEIVPDHEFAHNNLGLALWRLRRYDEAAAAFHRQTEINPLDRYADANLGQMNLELGRDSAAVAAFERAASVRPDDDRVYFDLARANLRTGRTDAAVAAFDRAFALRTSPSTLNNTAYELALAGVALDRAEQYVRRALDSTHAVLQDLTLVDAGPREALAAFSLGAYWDTLGWIYFQRGDLASAERYVRAAWLLTQRSAVGDHLARIEERLGRREAALRTYALALNARDSVPEARRRLEALAGGPARANRLIAAQRYGLQEMRTVRIPRVLRVEAAGEVRLLFAPGRVVEVAIAGGPDVLMRADSAIRAARFPVEFPDNADIRMPRSGLLSCVARSGDCTIVLFEGPAPSGRLR